MTCPRILSQAAIAPWPEGSPRRPGATAAAHLSSPIPRRPPSPWRRVSLLYGILGAWLGYGLAVGFSGWIFHTPKPLALVPGIAVVGLVVVFAVSAGLLPSWAARGQTIPGRPGRGRLLVILTGCWLLAAAMVAAAVSLVASAIHLRSVMVPGHLAILGLLLVPVLADLVVLPWFRPAPGHRLAGAA